MPTARDIMTPDATCVGEQESVVAAARKMAELDVGALPICGQDNRLKGMLTDRDTLARPGRGDGRVARRSGDAGRGGVSRACGTGTRS
jgi:CBS domain-containing protein